VGIHAPLVPLDQRGVRPSLFHLIAPIGLWSVGAFSLVESSLDLVPDRRVEECESRDGIYTIAVGEMGSYNESKGRLRYSLIKRFRIPFSKLP
jgi:hypothetical protein